MAGWKGQQMLAVGVQAPEFRLNGLDDSNRSLADVLAKGPALLVFFKVSCPVCQFTFPFLQRIYAGAGGENAPVQIIGISQDKAGPTREFNQEFGVDFPVLLDEGGYPASNAFGIGSVPSLFLVETDGRISISEAGFSRRDLESVGRRAGSAPFLEGERIPERRPG